MEPAQQSQTDIRTQEQESSLQDRAMLSGLLGIVSLALLGACIAPTFA